MLAHEERNRGNAKSDFWSTHVPPRALWKPYRRLSWSCGAGLGNEAVTDSRAAPKEWMYSQFLNPSLRALMVSLETRAIGREAFLTSRIAFLIGSSTLFLAFGGCGGSSEETDTQAPTAPTELAAQAASSDTINLTWKASTDNVGVAGYSVFRGDAKIADTTALSFKDIGLQAGTTYKYTISAFDAAGNVSAKSAVASATPSTEPTEIITARGTVTPSSVKKGDEFALAVTLSSTKNTTVDAVVEIDKPDGTPVYSLSLANTAISPGSPIQLNDSLEVESTDSSGLYSVTVTVSDSGTKSVLLKKATIAQLTITDN
jgi:chitodextrinase